MCSMGESGAFTECVALNARSGPRVLITLFAVVSAHGATVIHTHAVFLFGALRYAFLWFMDWHQATSVTRGDDGDKK